MAKKTDIFKYDYRVCDLNITRKNLTKDEYEQFLKALPDLTKQSEEFQVVEERNDSDPAAGGLTFSVG